MARTLTVLKGFTEGGKYYAPGEPAPKLHPLMVEKLIRARHLHDAGAKHEPVIRNELKVVENRRDDWVITPSANPSAPEGHKYVRGIPTEVPGTPAKGGMQSLDPEGQRNMGRNLAGAQDWNAPARSDTSNPGVPAKGTVVLDRVPTDPLAGRKLAALQDWKESA